MKIIKDRISLDELKIMAESMYGGLVKAVVDIEEKIMAVDAPLHADEEFVLLENGSNQENLWGINLFPDKYHTDEFIVFDSMINLRPRQGNRSRGVESVTIQKIIKEIVGKLVHE